MDMLGKHAYEKSYREFESPPLRPIEHKCYASDAHISEYQARKAIFVP
jgi:hypothetical protein